MHWSAVEHDVDAVIFHGGIQIFFHGGIEAVYLVNEQNIVGFQIGEKSGQVARLFKNRAGSYAHLHAQFVGNDIREGCFSKSGRTVKHHREAIEAYPSRDIANSVGTTSTFWGNLQAQLFGTWDHQRKSMTWQTSSCYKKIKLFQF